jgi:hypothetical protein
VASGYYQGTEGESLEQTSKNSIGLSNFIANFGKILRKRVISGKPEGEIKRVMDTEPVQINDTDFDLYKIPFKQEPQGAVTNGELTNSGLIDDLNKSEKTLKRPLDVMEGNTTESQNLDQDLDELMNVEKEQVVNKPVNTVQLVNDDQSNFSDDTDKSDEFEPILSKEELQEEHQKKLEKNEQMFEEFDKEIKSEGNMEATPVNTSSISENQSVSLETPKSNENLIESDQDVSEHVQLDNQSQVSHISNEIVETMSNQSPQEIQNEMTLDKEIQSTPSEENLDNMSMIDSSLDNKTKDNLDMSMTSTDISIQSKELQSTNGNADLMASQATNKSADKSQVDRKLKGSLVTEEKDSDQDRFNSINPTQNRSITSGRIKLKKTKSQNKIKMMSKSEKKRERKLNLASFLAKKHKHLRRSSRIFKHRSFIPSNELMTRKQKVKKKSFIPISYGHSDRGYINSKIISRDNSKGYTNEYRRKKSQMQLKKLNRNAFSVYGKKSWYKPKIKIFNKNESVRDDLYRGNPMINLI